MINKHDLYNQHHRAHTPWNYHQTLRGCNSSLLKFITFTALIESIKPFFFHIKTAIGVFGRGKGSERTFIVFENDLLFNVVSFINQIEGIRNVALISTGTSFPWKFSALDFPGKYFFVQNEKSCLKRLQLITGFGGNQIAVSFLWRNLNLFPISSENLVDFTQQKT